METNSKIFEIRQLVSEAIFEIIGGYKKNWKLLWGIIAFLMVCVTIESAFKAHSFDQLIFFTVISFIRGVSTIYFFFCIFIAFLVADCVNIFTGAKSLEDFKNPYYERFSSFYQRRTWWQWFLVSLAGLTGFILATLPFMGLLLLLPDHWADAIW